MTLTLTRTRTLIPTPTPSTRHQACHELLRGTLGAPNNGRLSRAFNAAVREARSRGRAEFAMPCPLHVQATFTMPSAGRDSGSDVGTGAATWHECPLCGMRWATGTKARVRRRAVEKVPTDETSESEEEEPGNSEEFEALLNAMDYLDLLTLRPSGEIDAEERARTEEGILSYYHEIKLIHS